jgi:arsenite-transporting ATPase
MLLDKELKNLSLLEEAAKMIYGDVDPTQVLFSDTIFKVDKNEEGYTMRIFIPFVDKKEMDLLQKGDELTLSIKNERRNFILPELLKTREISGAEYKEDALYINFS